MTLPSLAALLNIPQPLNLSEVQTRRYWSEGYLVVPGFFSTTYIQRVAQLIDDLVDIAATLDASQVISGTQFVIGKKAGGGHKIERIVGVGGCSPLLGRAGQAPTLVDACRQLLRQNKLVQLINQVHLKLPGDEVQFGWHQDSIHRRHGTPDWSTNHPEGGFVETITAIDPMTDTNGPVMVVPRSHLRGHLEHDEQRVLSMDQFCSEQGRPIMMSPGDVLFLSPFTIHSSGPNQSAQSRRTFLNGFAIEGINRRMYPHLGTGLAV